MRSSTIEQQVRELSTVTRSVRIDMGCVLDGRVSFA